MSQATYESETQNTFSWLLLCCFENCHQKTFFLMSNIFKVCLHQEVWQSSHKLWSYFCHSTWRDEHASPWQSILQGRCGCDRHQSVLETLATFMTRRHDMRSWNKVTLLKYYSSQHTSLSWGSLQACLLPCRLKEVDKHWEDKDGAAWPGNSDVWARRNKREQFPSSMKSHQHHTYKYFTSILYLGEGIDKLSLCSTSQWNDNYLLGQ